jgi:hypothetical protein
MSRNNSRNNSIDISRSRTSSWDNRRSNSFGSVETIELDTDNVTGNVKTISIKIVSNDIDKKRTRDVYIDMENPHKEPTPTPNSFLEKYMKSDLVWLKSNSKSNYK